MNTIMRYSLLACVLFTFLFSGCVRDAYLIRASMGYLGCEHEEMKLSEKDYSISGPLLGVASSWKINCKGKLYLCSAAVGMSCVRVNK